MANKAPDSAQDVELALRGAPLTGTYEVWQTVPGMDPADAGGGQWQDPLRIRSGTYQGGRILFPAPAMTVSTVLLGT